ncbi:MAG TPA: carboxypeptidase-like regulatory domain-containing protein, partial [Bryobacteraceae bacterium]
MRFKIAACLLLCAGMAFGQGAGGTLTGTVSDPTGAVVPNATIQVKNTQTSSVYSIGTSNTGNYTLPNLPVGTYELTVDASGFKKFNRPGIAIDVAATVRVDATLQVGAATDTVTVNAEAPLLKTESGEVSHQVDYTAASELPLFTTNGAGGATGTGNIRDPLSALNLLPGASQSTDLALVINGLPSSSQTIMVEGMDATNGMWREQNQSTQQGVDAIQEVSVQTSNFAAEYG